MQKDIVVTGIGIVAPPGIDKRPFWANIKSGRSFVSTIKRFDSSRYPSHIAGQIHEIEVYTHVSPRLLKKIDPFSHMAMIASELAINDAQIDLSKENLNRVGIFMGNALGGWLFAETELRDLYLEGREGVSPYMASAWFPAAPQGQISIFYGIKGYSKTVVADRASSLMAIGYAVKVLEKGKADLILAGGMEAPVTPYALLCCNTYGGLSLENDTPQTVYKPFDKNRSGFVIGEGSGVLILEPLKKARDRGVSIYAKVAGFSSTCDGFNRIEPDPEGEELARAINLAITQAGWEKEEVDYICCDALATKIADFSETKAIKKVFANFAKHIPLSAPKSMFGNLLGASGVVDTIITLLSMENNLIPPTINLNAPDPECDLDYVPNSSRAKEIKKALVISRGRGGINTVLALEKVG